LRTSRTRQLTDRSENELLEMAHDRLLPYEYPKKPLLPGFKCLVLQADSGLGLIWLPRSVGVDLNRRS
jgi:hypothetical protein